MKKCIVYCFILGTLLLTTGCDDLQQLSGSDYVPVLHLVSVTSATSSSMNVGDTRTFTARGYDQQGKLFTIDPTWSVVGDVGHVSPSGVFAAEIAGSANVVATDKTTGISGYARVTVTMPSTIETATLSTLEVLPKSVSLNVGETQIFHVIAYDKDGKVVSVYPVWFASPAIGNINQSGLFTASSVGYGTVNASFGGVRGAAGVLVRDSLVF